MTDAPDSPQHDDTAAIATTEIPATVDEVHPTDDLRTTPGRVTTALRRPRALAGSAATIVLLAGLGGFGVGRATAGGTDGGTVVPASAGVGAGQDGAGQDGAGQDGADGVPEPGGSGDTIPGRGGPGAGRTAPDQTTPDQSGSASTEDSSSI